MKIRRLVPLLVLCTVPLAFGQESAPPAAEAKPKVEVARVAELKLTLEATEDPRSELMFGDTTFTLPSFLEAVRKAARDPKIAGVLLKLQRYDVGWPRLYEMREVLQELRRAGKPLFVYAQNLSAPDLVLASVADRISMPESGAVFLPGLAFEIWYMRELLSKLHITFDVIHIGEYKTAGESLVRDTMSKELEESLDPLLDEYFDSMVGAIAEGRRISADQVRGAVDQGILNPRAAKAAGLIDRVEYEDQFLEGIEAFFPGKKVEIRKRYPFAPREELDLSNPLALMAQLMKMFGGAREKEPKGPKIAVVYCTGMIVSGKSRYDWNGGVTAMGSKTIVKAIDRAAKHPDVKAIVLRINSPGGSGLASDMIWRAVERAKKHKPVIASMGDVAASGGYYIAMNSHRIVAEPRTITGSIGVVGMVPNLEGFLGWIGIHPQRMSRGKRAEAFLTTKPLAEEDREAIRAYLKDFYEDFVAKVAAGRGRTPAEIDTIARGRIWTGRKAKEIGLVDELGGLERAVALARERSGLGAEEKVHLLQLPRRKSFFDMLAEGFEAGIYARAAAVGRLPELRRLEAQIRALRLMGADKSCAVVPELAALTRIASRPK